MLVVLGLEPHLAAISLTTQVNQGSADKQRLSDRQASLPAQGPARPASELPLPPAKMGEISAAGSLTADAFQAHPCGIS